MYFERFVLENGTFLRTDRETVAWGVSRWTASAGNRRIRRLGCQQMDLKRRKQAKTSSEVRADGPQKTESGRESFWRGWTRGIGGKAWSVEGDATEKCATLGIIRGRGQQADRSVATEGFKGNLPLVPWGCRGIVVFLSKTGRGRAATFSVASPSTDPKYQHLPSLGVPADRPQKTETGENVVWGAGRWTSNDGNRQKRRLRCGQMDLKRRKRALTVAWGADAPHQVAPAKFTRLCG